MPASNRRPLYSDEELQAGASAAAVAAAATPALAAASSPVQRALNSTEPALVQAGDTPFRQPCTLKGVASAAYAGALGYFLGFVPAAIKFKGRQWGMVHAQGVASASQLAVMSGMYTAVHCICQRIRSVEDGWNRGIAGCSTGLVLGWKAGPWSALQSCAGIGLLSALIDLGGGAAEAAEASMLGQLQQAQQQCQLHDTTVAGTPLDFLAPLLASIGRRQTQQQRLLQQQTVQLQQDTVQPGSSSSNPAGWQFGQQHLQQQALAVFQANGLQPAVRQLNAAAQLLVAAPPLAFLSACCSSPATPDQPQSRAAAAAGGHVHAVDACAVAAADVLVGRRNGRRH